MGQTITGVKTRVKNTSGGTKKFPFLPPHGVELADEEEVDIDGDLRTRLSGHKRKMAGLNAALLSGDLDIVFTPQQAFYDATADAIKTIRVDDDVVEVVDATWDSA